jgi:hypothetical protein
MTEFVGEEALGGDTIVGSALAITLLPRLGEAAASMDPELELPPPKAAELSDDPELCGWDGVMLPRPGSDPPPPVPKSFDGGALGGASSVVALFCSPLRTPRPANSTG